MKVQAPRIHRAAVSAGGLVPKRAMATGSLPSVDAALAGSRRALREQVGKKNLRPEA